VKSLFSKQILCNNLYFNAITNKIWNIAF